MNSLSSTRLTAPLRLSVFVDADNIPATFAPEILRIARLHGAPDLLRAYGNACNLPSWDVTAGFHLIHSGSGKNAADMLICLDAMERALREECEAVLLVSSDQDFTHLATRLRGYGLTVIGAGETKTPDRFSAACSSFHALENEAQDIQQNAHVEPTPRRLQSTETVTRRDRKVREIIDNNSKGKNGLEIQKLGALMSCLSDKGLSNIKEKSWRAYLANRPALYSLDPKGPNAKVRYKPTAFQPVPA